MVELAGHGDQKNLMLRLSKAMMRVRNLRGGAEQDNPDIPAGYTYLGQLIAHDLAFTDLSNLKFEARPAAPTTPASNALAAATLDLGPLYGAGPDRAPQLYQRTGARLPRWKLRLSPMQQRATGGPLQFPQAIGDAMDLTRCPLVSGDPLAITADARNDMHLLISQLMVLFAKFHNGLADHVEQGLEREAVLQGTTFDKRQLFPQTRALVVAVYRRVVLDDFLARLCDPGIYKRTRDLINLYRHGPIPFPDRRARNVVPRAFASAAFRVGHVMARASYSLSVARTATVNGNGHVNADGPSLSSIFDQTGTRISGANIQQNWDIEWDRFFFDTDGAYEVQTPDGRVRNFSHKISPAAPTALVNKDRFGSDDEQQGGIIYLDLMRAFADELHDADAIIPELAINVPEASRLASTERQAMLTRHFTVNGVQELSDSDIGKLSDQTPLYLYTLLEAMAEPSGGTNLGPVGSTIVAGTITHALLDTIGETESARQRWDDLNISKPMPGTMPELLEFMT